MRFRITTSLLLLLCLAPCLTEAGGGPPALRYRGGAQGRVIFDHQLHASKGARCADCHTDYQATGKQLFATRKQGRISFADHTAATKCFACHDGKDKTQRFDECSQCHRKATGA